MANEATLTTYNDLFPASVIADAIIDEERPYNAMTEGMFLYHGPDQSNIVDWPIQQDPGVAAGSTEGTGISNVASGMGSDKASATLGTVGQMTTVTDELVSTVKFDIPSHVARVLGRSIAEKFQTDATALIDDFANTTGTTGVANTASQLQAAKNALAQRDQTGQAVGVLDPSQVGNVVQDFGTTGAAIFANDAIAANELLSPSLEAFAFSYAGVPWFQTSLVTTSGGGVFIAGLALGLYEAWPLRIETQRDASMPGTEVVAFRRYGMIEVRDRAGQTILY